MAFNSTCLCQLSRQTLCKRQKSAILLKFLTCVKLICGAKNKILQENLHYLIKIWKWSIFNYITSRVWYKTYTLKLRLHCTGSVSLHLRSCTGSAFPLHTERFHRSVFRNGASMRRCAIRKRHVTLRMGL